MQIQTAGAAGDLDHRGADIAVSFSRVRQRSEALCAPLEIEDYGLQPMPDASPAKWHLAHTTWFFETFILNEWVKGYEPFSPNFETLFNSYYNGVGAPFPRHRRGELSRPTVRRVYEYRARIDGAVGELLETRGDDEALRARVTLGLQHEQQHQELLLTDLKYAFGHNPLFPVYHEHSSGAAAPRSVTEPLRFVERDEAVVTIGHRGTGFAFDNESPAHRVLIGAHALADRLVTNGEYLSFVEDEGYRRADLWLASAWTRIQEHSLSVPLYWHQRDGDWFEYRLDGLKPLDLSRPVLHVSAYEADAYARWAGARLPTEFEWEAAAQQQQPDAAPRGNFADSGWLHSAPCNAVHAGTSGADALPRQAPLAQLYGDAWEWTMSSYSPYPGYAPLAGTLGEYNGKFMSEQLVLRGGSCFTPSGHVRSSYRNFFYPPDRWQATGIRLARSLSGAFAS